MIDFNKSITAQSIIDNMDTFKALLDVTQHADSTTSLDLDIEYFYEVSSSRALYGRNIFDFHVTLKGESNHYQIDINLVFKYDFDDNSITNVESNIYLDDVYEQKKFEFELIMQAIDDGIDQVVNCNGDTIQETSPYFGADFTKDMTQFAHISNAFFKLRQQTESAIRLLKL